MNVNKILIRVPLMKEKFVSTQSAATLAIVDLDILRMQTVCVKVRFFKCQNCRKFYDVFVVSLL